MDDRDRAILQAREIMKMDFVVFDTETTGLSPENGDEAVSLGLVSKSGDILLDTLLRHSKRSRPEALRVHGHTWEATREAPRLAKILPELRRLTSGKSILCYCVGNFDANILISTCSAHCMPTLDLRRRTIQALEPFAQFYGEWNDYRQNYKWQSLTTAAQFFGIDTAGAHGAAVDALMTLKVVQAMAAWELSGEQK
jgi:DNA polymerase-3 subunit epsilon